MTDTPTSVEVAAAKLKVAIAKTRGRPVDPRIRQLAESQPAEAASTAAHRARREKESVYQKEEITLSPEQSDPLTGLLNRHGLERAIGAKLAEPDRNSRCALALVDLHNFQTINDMLGHEMGNRVLRESAQRLAGVARPGDLVGRVGGDEFAVFLTDLPTLEMAEPRAGALVGALGVKIRSGDSTISSDARCGLAYVSDIETFDDIFLRAEQALMIGKLLGDRVTPYTPPPPGGSVRAPGAGHNSGPES